MTMAKSDSLDQLGYVLHLLQDVKYFHQTNVHACTCDICDKKTSLVRSSISMAIEKVNEISSSLHASQLINSPENYQIRQPSNANAGSPKNPTITISSSPSSNYLTNCVPFDKQVSPVKIGETERCLAPPLVHQYSSTCSSLLSSTQRDSGVHTENFLHSSTISPIRNSDLHDSTSESSDSDNHKSGGVQKSNVSQTSPKGLKRLSDSQHHNNGTFKIGSEKQYNDHSTSQLSSANYNISKQDSCQSEQMKSPASTLMWHNPLPMHHLPFNQFYPYRWLPLPSPQFPDPFSPHFSSRTVPDDEKSSNYFQDNHFQSLYPGTLPQPQSQSLINVPYNAWHSHAPADHTCQVNSKQPQVIPAPPSQVFEMKCNDLKIGHQGLEHDAKSAYLSPQYQEMNISGVASFSSHPKAISGKDVMLNDVRLRDPSENDTVSSNLSVSISSCQDDTSSDLNIRDVSGAMWRPWEAKEDVYRIISDLSIKEEDSAELQSSSKCDFLGEEQMDKFLSCADGSKAMPLNEGNIVKDLQNEENITKDLKENAVILELENVLSEINLYSDYQSNELGQIFESPVKKPLKKRELIEIDNSCHQKTKVKFTKGTNILSQSFDNENGLKRYKKKRSDRGQPSKENCQSLDLTSSPIYSMRQCLSSSSLHDISNTLRQSSALIRNNHETNKMFAERMAEKDDLVIEELISGVSKKLDVDKSSPSFVKSLIMAPKLNGKSSTDHGDRERFFSDENSCFPPSNPTSSLETKEQCFNTISSEVSKALKHASQSQSAFVPSSSDKTHGDSGSDPTETQSSETNSTQFHCMNVNVKQNSDQNSSISSLSDYSHNLWQLKKLRKSQSDTLLPSEYCQKRNPDTAQSLSPSLEKEQCFDADNELLSLTLSSPNTSPEKCPQAPKWGAPAIVGMTSKEKLNNNLGLFKLEEDERKLFKQTDSCENEANTSDEIENDSLNPLSQGRNTIENAVTPPKGRETSGSGMKKDRRSRITALCHDRIQMQLNKDQFNRSLPVTTKLHANQIKSQFPSKEDLGSVSFEVNQSFPKMGKQQMEAKDCQTFGGKNHDALDWCHVSTPLEVGDITPRNRRSVFGLSPPERSSLHFQPSHSHEKDQVSLRRESEASSFSSGVEEEYLNFNVESVCEAMDLSYRFPRLPSLKEILFNCVTDSICLIDPNRKGKIISVNETFQLMIGLHEKIIGQRLFRFIKIRQSVEELAVSVPHKIILSDGSVTTVCGKQVSCVVATGEEMPVSIWTVRLQSQRDIVACMINIAPTLVGTFYVNDDLDFLQEEEANDLISMDECPLSPCISGVITGLIVVQSDGFICDFDYCFFHLLLEHDNLLKVNISELLTHIMNNDEESKDEKSRASDVSEFNSSGSGLVGGMGDVNKLTELDTSQGQGIESDGLLLPASCFVDDELENISHLNDLEPINKCDRSTRGKPDFDLDISSRYGIPSSVESAPQTSTPCKRGQSEEDAESPSVKKDAVKLYSGVYSASFLCGNGSYKDVCFKMSSVQTARGRKLFCLWVYIQQEESSFESDSDEEDSDGEGTEEELESDCHDEAELARKKLKNLCVSTKLQDEVVNTSLGQMVTEQAALNQSHNATNEDVMDLEQGIKGSFAQHYVTLATLGQGSFGFVRKARPIIGEPKSVVVKFIRKRSMFDDAWVRDGDQVLPSEVTILRALDHEHIIKVMDVHQNNEFVQMVMEDFGDLDLFDFIDQAEIDESLACYLFRQIISGVDHLHSCNILHRDIKDENVIINSSFHCKLIDFGSAAYMLPRGQLFTKFRGTLEYCSPEVHLGRGYRGPELDAWALGITLYTMVFRENPYTADCIPYQMKTSDLPFTVTQDLTTLLFGLMCCDPCKRYSIVKSLGSDWLIQIVDMSKYKWEDLLGSAPNMSKSCESPQD